MRPSASLPRSLLRNVSLQQESFKRLVQLHKNEAACSKAETSAIEDARREVRWIIEEVEQRAIEVNGGNKDDVIQDMIKRRSFGEPLAYILGNQPFGPLTIACEAPVLIPRIETELLAEHVADRLIEELSSSVKPLTRVKLLDLCTGTGCIAIYLRHRLQEWLLQNFTRKNIRIEIHAVDVSPQAISLATRNAQAMPHAPENLSFAFHQLDILDYNAMSAFFSDNGPFDLIISNPPYISKEDHSKLTTSVRDFEDSGALIGGDDGLLFYKALAKLLSNEGNCLTTQRNGLRLAMEVGHNQADAVQRIFEEQKHPHLQWHEVWQDPFGIKRGILFGK